MKSSEIRERFLKYFESKNHTRVSSSALIPENDPTILFTNAGMNQFKNLFLGLEKRPYVRAVSSQKCVRAGGKHNDLENVGFTARHHTFFEMLGNFSFGEYFKKDAIHFAWEFLTQELKIPKEKLYITVYKDDDEAANIWHTQEKVPLNRIFRLDQDNFWRMGDIGPCGPSSEIFYDHGERAGTESDPFKGIVSGEDRFVEIWNLVFMQFEETSPGVLNPLPKPSVDTGSGLERVAAAMQGKLNNYDTDLFWPLILKAAELSQQTQLLPMIEDLNINGVKSKVSAENRKKIAALRVIADHTRSASFLIADGVLPSNEGRGYVLRRILRRAIRFCQNLSQGKSFLPEVSEVLIREMSSIYPELNHRKELILSTLGDEQKKFSDTLKTGMELLQTQFQQNEKSKTLSGEVVFKLYDTYGFPVDLTRMIADEKNFKIDEAGFEKIVAESKLKSKASWKSKSLNQNETHLVAFVEKFKSHPSEFLGYETLTSDSTVLGLSDGEKEISTLSAGQTGFLVTARTPFYAEGGGQAGDLGHIRSLKSNAQAQVLDCTKKNNIYLHAISVETGSFSVSEPIQLSVSNSERRQTAAHHSATHLLHSALRKVLGTGVTQAGQMVDAQRIRFDFTHSKPLSQVELKQIEDLVNNQIFENNAVACEVTSPELAIKNGAIALFGEKYGDKVRVLSMGDFSVELCGGTHVSNTSQILGFKIMSETGVSAGIRRIEALAGERLMHLYTKSFAAYTETKKQLSSQETWTQLLEEGSTLSHAAEALKAEVKALEKELKSLKQAKLSIEDFISQKKVNSIGTNFICSFADTEDRELLSKLGDQLRDKIGSCVVIIVGAGSDSHPVLVTVSKDLSGKYKAGDVLKTFVAPLGGKGGGRPDFAQGSCPAGSSVRKAIEGFVL